MNLLELLKRAFEWDANDYRNMPDFGRVLEHLGVHEDDMEFYSAEDIRAAIGEEINGLTEAEGDSENGDDGEGENDGDVE